MNEWHKAEKHAERAHEAFQAGELDPALAELKKALAVNPEQGEWHFGMGLTLDQMQRYEEATDCFRKALDLRGDDVETMLHLGVDLIRTNRSRAAIDILERAGKIDPTCEPTFCYRIAAHAQLGEHEQAEEMFYLARQIVDECPLCYDHVAQSLSARGEWERAAWCWQQVLKLDAHYPDANAHLARLHWRRRQHERARHYFIEQLREDPGDTDTLLQLGNLLIEMGRPAEASEKFRRVLELDPKVADAHLHLGELALASGHLDAASTELEMADKLDPSRAGVHLRMAQVAHKRGRPDKAIEHLQTEMGRGGHETRECLDIARLLIELHRPKPAIDLLNPMIREAVTGPHDDESLATALLYRGVASMKSGRIEHGITDCRRALRLAPRNTLAMQNLVLAYVEQKRFPRARYWLRRAAELEPQDTHLRQLRHMLRFARWKDAGRRARAALASRLRFWR